MIEPAAPNPPRPPRPGQALVAVLTVTAMVATLVVFAATSGFGWFGRQVDVLLIGDSIMAQSGPYVREVLAAQPGIGSVKVHLEGRPGTGLLTPGLFDWSARARELIDEYEPDVVVVLFIGNYTDQPDAFWSDPEGVPIPNEYDERFFAAWQREAEALDTSLAARGAQVDWVLPPPMFSDEGARRQRLMRATYEGMTATRPAIALVDGRAPLAGPDGGFSWERPGVDGTVVTVRQGDSVHLTEAGGLLLARRMAEDVAPQLIASRARAQ